MTSVILVTIDGIRHHEMFKGVDPLILDGKSEMEKQMVRSRFNTRSSITPFLTNCRDKIENQHLTIKNRTYHSYPGYNEIITGNANPKIIDNDFGINPTSNFMEDAVNDKIIGLHETLLSASWYTFVDIYASSRSHIYSQPNTTNSYFQLGSLDPDYSYPTEALNIKP